MALQLRREYPVLEVEEDHQHLKAVAVND
jgi:hypothetical protein